MCFLNAKQLTILLKPASGLCQLSCRYCFYNDLASAGAVVQKIMQSDTVSALIQLVADNLAKDGHVTFAFQGGEPLLAGIDFYRDFFSRVQEANLHASYLFQTNGIALCNKENGNAFIQLFKEHHCLIGLSVDGDRVLHNTNRIDAEGNGTFDLVMDAYKKLTDAGVAVNFLTVLSKKVLSHPTQLYNFYKKSGIKHIQLIPCLPPLDHTDTTETRRRRDLLAPFWIQFYDLWRQDFQNGKPPFEVREFYAILRALQGAPVDSCIFPGKCSPQLIVESDGSLYPCDFYVLPQYCTGSILTDTLEDTLRSPGMLRFAKENPPLPTQCQQCAYKGLCNGGCRRMRHIWHPDWDDCPMKLFLNHICNY